MATGRDSWRRQLDNFVVGDFGAVKEPIRKLLSLRGIPHFGTPVHSECCITPILNTFISLIDLCALDVRGNQQQIYSYKHNMSTISIKTTVQHACPVCFHFPGDGHSLRPKPSCVRTTANWQCTLHILNLFQASATSTRAPSEGLDATPQRTGTQQHRLHFEDCFQKCNRGKFVVVGNCTASSRILSLGIIDHVMRPSWSDQEPDLRPEILSVLLKE